jgi:hypothetical protein
VPQPFRTRFRQWRKIVRWRLKGAPLPPPHDYKIATLRRYREAYGLRTLVETGTFMGDMIEAQKTDFDRLISVELSEELHRKAKARFSGDAHVEILQGDSGQLIGDVVGRLQGPALFWLDGHYSGGETALGSLQTPIVNELKAVLGSPLPHVVLIDDARCFDGTHDYPDLASLQTLAGKLKPGCSFEVAHDLIRICPPG